MTLQHQKQFLPQDSNKNHTSKTFLCVCALFLLGVFEMPNDQAFPSNDADPVDILEVESLMK